MVERTRYVRRCIRSAGQRVVSRADDVPASIARLADAARTAEVRMLSHDDETPAMRQGFRAQGVGIAEFPINEETAREAADGGDFIVFGAPNVVRGGSHTGWTKATDMIAKGLCSVLASDYYYPAPLLAAFRLAADGVLPLAEAWKLISDGAGPGRGPRRPRRSRRQDRAPISSWSMMNAAAAAHRGCHRCRPPGASDRRKPARRRFGQLAQSSCGSVTGLYSGTCLVLTNQNQTSSSFLS